MFLVLLPLFSYTALKRYRCLNSAIRSKDELSIKIESTLSFLTLLLIAFILYLVLQL